MRAIDLRLEALKGEVLIPDTCLTEIKWELGSLIVTTDTGYRLILDEFDVAELAKVMTKVP